MKINSTFRGHGKDERGGIVCRRDGVAKVTPDDGVRPSAIVDLSLDDDDESESCEDDFGEHGAMGRMCEESELPFRPLYTRLLLLTRARACGNGNVV